MIKFDKEGNLIGFFCKRGEIGMPPLQKPDTRTEKQKLLDKLKNITKPKIIEIENENTDGKI